MCRLYNIDPADKKEMKVKMLKLAEKWRPYRTYAVSYTHLDVYKRQRCRPGCICPAWIIRWEIVE